MQPLAVDQHGLFLSPRGQSFPHGFDLPPNNQQVRIVDPSLLTARPNRRPTNQNRFRFGYGTTALHWRASYSRPLQGPRLLLFFFFLSRPFFCPSRRFSRRLPPFLSP